MMINSKVISQLAGCGVLVAELTVVTSQREHGSVRSVDFKLTL